MAVDESYVDESIAPLVNIYGANNLLPNNNYSQEIQGITFTVNSDGSVTANGTATSKIWFLLYLVDNASRYNNIFKGKKLIFSGCQNGSYSTYYLSMEMNGTNFVNNYNNSTTITMPEFNSRFSVYVVIADKATVSNVVFYPMIRDARIKDSTYVPYAMTNRELSYIYDTTITENGLKWRLFKCGKIAIAHIESGTLTEAVAVNGLLINLPREYTPVSDFQGRYTNGDTNGRWIMLSSNSTIITGGQETAGTALRLTAIYITRI